MNLQRRFSQVPTDALLRHIDKIHVRNAWVCMYLV